MISKFLNIFKIADLRKKLFFTSMIILIYRLCGVIPVPGIDKKAIADSDFQRKIVSMKNEISGEKMSKIVKGNA